ncbi:XRE family transcriptional regulator [Micromonospora polyrhachis]|uniref:Tetratricopeptide (TPR) repeat protein/DNA-binding XRE family transcriptional regulator n=1 Tax=Micromonospora polyrhachis TaxID=1282883 RepID=A0A7W7SMS4_9ACTN|nr:tetratricopeptide repeat protein [Micromonospora polyrhachis]MBB4956460.1 tetratricopeptide (TPR) repeat protein/DNA-binding XRE family transcriptional regulator [Micromonospora polyrhachis]
MGTAPGAFGSALRVLRERARLTQEQLAERAGLSTNAISALERGARRRPYPSTIRALAEALGLSAEERVELERVMRGRAVTRRPEPPSDGTPPHQDAALVPHPEVTVPMVVPRQPPVVVPRQLPAVGRDFVGRTADLAQLDALLSAEPASGPGVPSPVVISAIGGTAGVGKTTLALIWAHRMKDRFPNGQLYVNLRGYDPGPPAAPSDVLEAFLRALNVAPEGIPARLEERAALFRSSVDNRRLLMLLDNAGNAEQVRPLLPGSSTCVVLVTSRARLDGLAVSVGAVHVTLDVLPVADAVTLLRTLVGAARSDAEPHALTALAGSCARLPLALRLAGQRLASRPYLRITDLVDELDVETRRLDVLSAGEDAFTAVRSVFSWSYRSLSTTQARMFRLLGLHPGPDISTHAAAALAGIPLTEARQLVDGLADAHLVEHVGRDRCRLHDLLRAYAREQAQTVDTQTDRLEAVRRLVGFYLHSASVAGHLLHPRREPAMADGAPVPVQLAPVSGYDEALAWCEAERVSLVAVTSAAAEHGMFTAAWQLPNTLWSFYYIRKYWADWATVCQIGLDAARRSEDCGGQARMLSGLASVYRDLHRFDEAILHYQRALDLNRRLGDRFGEARLLSNIGDVYLGLRRYNHALDYSFRALVILREVGDPYFEGVALGNLAEAYLGLHRYDEALESFQRVLELCRKIDHRHGEGRTLIHLGETHLGLLRHDDALDHLHRAVQLCRDIGNSHGEGMAWKIVGQVHQATGRSEKARRCWQTSARILREVGGPEADEVLAQLRRLTG